MLKYLLVTHTRNEQICVAPRERLKRRSARTLLRMCISAIRKHLECNTLSFAIPDMTCYASPIPQNTTEDECHTHPDCNYKQKQIGNKWFLIRVCFCSKHHDRTYVLGHSCIQKADGVEEHWFEKCHYMYVRLGSGPAFALRRICYCPR